MTDMSQPDTESCEPMSDRTELAALIRARDELQEALESPRLRALQRARKIAPSKGAFVGPDTYEILAIADWLLADGPAQSTIPDGWTGPTAEIHEHEPPREPIHVDVNGLLPGACGNHRPGTGICTRPAGHPRTLHIARDVTGRHLGEWDAN